MGGGELASHGEIAIGRVVDAHDSAGLFGVVLRVPEQHRMPHMRLRLDPHEPAASVDDLGHGRALPASALMVFRDNRNAHAERDAFAAAAISRIHGAGHDRKRSDLRFELILHGEVASRRAFTPLALVTLLERLEADVLVFEDDRPNRHFREPGQEIPAMLADSERAPPCINLLAPGRCLPMLRYA